MRAGVIEATMRFTLRPWMGTCAETEARMSEHLEGGLPARQERRFGRHLLHCHRCRAAYTSFREAVGQLRSLGQDELAHPAPSVADAVVDRLRHESH